MAPPPVTSDVPDEAALTEQLRHDLETLVRQRDDAFRALQEREAELARIQRIGKDGGFEGDLREGVKVRRSPEYLMIHGLPPEARNETQEEGGIRGHSEDREQALKDCQDALACHARQVPAQYRT